MQIMDLPLTRIIEEGDEVRTYCFAPPSDFTWEAGAHVHVGLPELVPDGKRNRDLVRHMSICTLPGEGRRAEAGSGFGVSAASAADGAADGAVNAAGRGESRATELSFTTRLNSSDSHFKQVLRGAKPGDEYKFFKMHCTIGLRRDDRPVVLLSQGVGVAAMRPLVLDYQRDQSGVPLLWNLTVDRVAPGQGIFEEALAAVTTSGYRYQRAANRQEFEETARRLDLQQGELADSWLVVVGSDEFMGSTVNLLRSQGASDEQIILDLPPVRRDKFFAELDG